MARIYAFAPDGSDARLSVTLYNWSGSLTSNGWTKFPNGLILQWGTGNTYTQISIPLTFPSNKWYTSAIHVGSDSNFNIVAELGRHGDKAIDYFITNYTSNNKNIFISWIAIGN